MHNHEHPVLQLERAALNRWGRGETAGYTDISAADVSYFDPLVARRIDSLAAMLEYYKPWQGQIKVPRYEILNPLVVDSGTLALLTYNLVNYVHDKVGKEVVGSCWNCTECYRLDVEGWRIVHSHWSFTAHEAFRALTPQQSEGG